MKNVYYNVSERCKKRNIFYVEFYKISGTVMQIKARNSVYSFGLIFTYWNEVYSLEDLIVEMIQYPIVA